MPQLTALVLLTPESFGRFSLTYLLYAFGASLALSIIMEPWHFHSLKNETAKTTAYLGASAVLSTGITVIAFVGAIIVDLGIVEACIAAAASGAAVLKATIRYINLQKKRFSAVIFSDISFVSCFALICSLLIFLGAPSDTSIYAGWLLAASTTVFFTPPLAGHLLSPRQWGTIHKAEIRRLLPESLLMDAGAILTPMLLAPILGISNFGVYRAVSNVTAPVRLILNPLRPVISEYSDNRLAPGQRLWWMVVTFSVFLGGCCLLIFTMISFYGLEVGVITSLLPAKIPVSIVVAGSFLTHFSYIRARSTFNASHLLTGRIIETIIVTVLPITAVFVGGLWLAIWGLALSSCLSALTWTVLHITSGRKTR